MTFAARRARGRATILVTCALALVVAASVHAWAKGSDDANAAAAARLVERMRGAPALHDFAGTATITWRSGSSPRQAQVHVKDSKGSLAVESGGRVVFDDGRHTYLHDSLGWTSMLVDPDADKLPAPDHYWALSTTAGPTVAGRTTEQVVVKRRNGSVAQRLVVDRATGLLVSRAVLDTQGHVERSLAFTTLEIGQIDGAVKVPVGARAARVRTLATVPDGYRAPASPGGGYRLITRERDGDGIVLFYSDGIFSASVQEQRGPLDGDALPAGSASETLAGRRVRRYADPNGDVLVWQRGGLVFTLVSDAPDDVTERMIEGLDAPARSVPDAIVDFVLGPFGWN